jgi:acyl carrier protein
MTRDEIRSEVAGVLSGIAPEVDLGKAPPSANLREWADIDSMDWLNFVVGLHQKLGVEIEETDYANVRSLEALLDFLAAKGAARR